MNELMFTALRARGLRRTKDRGDGIDFVFVFVFPSMGLESAQG